MKLEFFEKSIKGSNEIIKLETAGDQRWDFDDELEKHFVDLMSYQYKALMHRFFISRSVPKSLVGAAILLSNVESGGLKEGEIAKKVLRSFESPKDIAEVAQVLIASREAETLGTDKTEHVIQLAAWQKMFPTGGAFDLESLSEKKMEEYYDIYDEMREYRHGLKLEVWKEMFADGREYAPKSLSEEERKNFNDEFDKKVISTSGENITKRDRKLEAWQKLFPKGREFDLESLSKKKREEYVKIYDEMIIYPRALELTVWQEMFSDGREFDLGSLTEEQKAEYGRRYDEGLTKMSKLDDPFKDDHLTDFHTNLCKNLLTISMTDSLNTYEPPRGNSSLASAYLVIAKDASIAFDNKTTKKLVDGVRCMTPQRQKTFCEEYAPALVEQEKADLAAREREFEAAAAARIAKNESDRLQERTAAMEEIERFRQTLTNLLKLHGDIAGEESDKSLPLALKDSFARLGWLLTDKIDRLGTGLHNGYFDTLQKSKATITPVATDLQRGLTALKTIAAADERVSEWCDKARDLIGTREVSGAASLGFFSTAEKGSPAEKSKAAPEKGPSPGTP